MHCIPSFVSVNKEQYRCEWGETKKGNPSPSCGTQQGAPRLPLGYCVPPKEGLVLLKCQAFLELRLSSEQNI